MTGAMYHQYPDTMELEATITNSRPGAVQLDRMLFFPGGGGQLPDRGKIVWAGVELDITGFASDESGLWHVFESDVKPEGPCILKVDQGFREMMCELHTIAHVVNAIVYQNFGNPLLTGAQLADNDTLRLDFDLPGADNSELRALADPVNEVIRQGLEVKTTYMPWDEAQSIPGIFRSKSVSPPRQPDGMARIVEINGLDRQACGGTHLRSTDQSRAVKILKVENKGRQNRRIRIGMVD
jgi:misacylated tRNA(Ala) deacylase